MRHVLLFLVLTACSENEMAKHWGGSMQIDLPCGTKLTQVTWKDDSDLWYATRPLRSEESPETTTFESKTAYGWAEGKVILQETRCTEEAVGKYEGAKERWIEP